MQHKFVWGVIAVGAIFALGLVTGRYYRPADNMPALEPIAGENAGTGHQHVHAQTAYVCPMHPQVVSKEPGTCPICGMALVPAKHNSPGPDANTENGSDAAEPAGGDARPPVHVDPEVINSLGVKLTPVIRTTLMRRIEVPGFVQQIQPGRTARVLAPFDARIVSLPFKPGQWLKKGQPLVVLESDELRDAEQMHLSLLAQGSPETTPADAAAGESVPAAVADVPPTAEESRQRLAGLGLSDEAIARLEQEQTPSSQLTLYAPFAGTVANLRVAADAPVSQGKALFEFTGMARATVLANAFQRDAAWIQNGEAVEVRLPHVSGQVWHGLVNQAAVSIDPNSQNIGVRLSFSAPTQLLKSAMYVVATVLGDPREAVLAVPQQALIRTEQEDRVVVALGQGRFRPVPVKLASKPATRSSTQRPRGR